MEAFGEDSEWRHGQEKSGVVLVMKGQLRGTQPDEGQETQPEGPGKT
jgi:hypothetical protein